MLFTLLMSMSLFSCQPVCAVENPAIAESAPVLAIAAPELSPTPTQNPALEQQEQDEESAWQAEEPSVVPVTEEKAPSKTEETKTKAEEKQEAIGVIKIFDTIRSPEETIKKIREFSEDQTIKGILLMIDSGGGSIGSSEILFREMQELSEQKPIVTLVINCCCSGAYWVAIASDWIVAQSASSIGSIGVKHIIEKCKNYKQTDPGFTADMDVTVICAGKYKGLSDTSTAALNDEEYVFIQEKINQQYDIFTSFVAQARGLSLETVSEWADGKDFTGAKALKLGLIDQIGGYSDAVKKLEQLIADRGTVITQKLAFVE